MNRPAGVPSSSSLAVHRAASPGFAGPSRLTAPAASASLSHSSAPAGPADHPGVAGFREPSGLAGPAGAPGAPMSSGTVGRPGTAGSEPGEPTFPELLRYHRLRAGLTQRALADLSTVSPRTIRDLESGRANARTQTIYLLADGLRLQGPMRELFVRSSLSGRGTPPSAVTPAVRAPGGGWPGARLHPMLGRDVEVRALSQALTAGRRRAVVLSGLPGVGKTCLAAGIAESLAAANGWPVRWAGATEAMAGSGLTPDPGDVTAIDPRRGPGRGDVLLVLDGVPEHPTADLVEDLLARRPGLHVLVTSRDPWSLAGVPVAVVGPLAVPAEMPADPAAPGTAGPAGAAEAMAYPAVRLLLDRLAQVRPGLVLDAGDREAAVRLCRRVDGLPLAIEVAASRGRVLSPRQLADLPTGDLLALTVPGRTITLGDTLAQALDDLAPGHRTLLSDLARPQRTWSVAEAATMLARPLDCTIDGLDTLIGRGLVQASHGSAVTALHVPNLIRALLRRTARPALAG
ncbi:helix-turn-helix domain-containing protein [Actinoplanes sp. NPDC020271]|uniref:helix-turn-helix domain-containing protein n=1 Tax=Actinoplanes sp. NPDC020271 TaxID=3363896 RepID=UPI003799D81B